MLWILILFILLLICWWCMPLLHPVRPVLPVLLIGPVGNPPAAEKYKSRWISAKKLANLFQHLQQKNFTPVLPTDIISGKLPQQPVLLLFADGYQNIFTIVFPLLQQYQFKAAVAVPVGLIRQYDAWQTKSPWQNLLTEKQIKNLSSSKQIEFISQGLDNVPLDSLSNELAVWQLQESQFRFMKQYHCKLRACLFAQPTPQRQAVLTAARQQYALLIGHKTGNNPLPLPSTPLRVFALKTYVPLSRLMWKLRRF